MNIKKYVSLATGLAMLGGIALATPVLADTTPSPMGTATNTGSHMERGGRGMGGMRGGMMGMKGVFGTVSAMNGSTLTVSGRQGFSTTTPNTTFTVDATNAKVMKDRTVGTLANIAIGDTIMVSGTVTGTNIVATMIRDGNMPNPGTRPESAEPQIQGNGQPIVGGKISAISGNSITVVNVSNITYTVDITNAKITQGAKVATATNLTIGDPVVVQGTVNGTLITATSVIDQMKPTTDTPGASKPAQHRFFGGIGGFFSHMFGF